MKKMQFYVPEPMIRQLDAIAKARDVTRAEVVRGALGKYLEGVRKVVTLDEFAGRMQGGESRYVPGKRVTYIGPIRITFPGDMAYDFYAEWSRPDDIRDEDGDLTSDGDVRVYKRDCEQAKKAYDAYLAGRAFYLNVEGVSDRYNNIMGDDIAE